MAKIDLGKLSSDELKTLRKDIDKALVQKDKTKRKEALAAAEKAARDRGFSLAELLDKRKPARAPVAARYKHPSNPDLTWSGRGRKPKWFHDALEAGTSPEEMEI